MRVALNNTNRIILLKEAVRKKYAEKLQLEALPYSVEERDTWPIQLEEANRWLADNTTATPMLSAIASERGLTIEALVAKIKTKDEQYRTNVGAILGAQQRELDLLP